MTLPPIVARFARDAEAAGYTTETSDADDLIHVRVFRGATRVLTATWVRTGDRVTYSYAEAYPGTGEPPLVWPLLSHARTVLGIER